MSESGGGTGRRLFAAMFLLYCAASPGNLPGDTEVRWSVARQIVRGAGLEIEDGLKTKNFVIARQGRRYSFYGLGQSLCLVPFAAAGLAAEKAGIVGAETADLGAQFLASLIFFPAVGGVLVLLFYRLVLEMGYARRCALTSAMVLGLCTMHFHYSVCTQEQTQVGLLLVVAVLMMVRHAGSGRFFHAWLSCAALGGCLLFRPGSVVMALPIYCAAAVSDVFKSGARGPGRTAGKWLLAGLLGTGGFVVLCGWYNYSRFGDFFESGYSLVGQTAFGGHGMFESSPLPTLAAILFSPGKGIFLYNPVLAAAALCVPRFYRRHKAAAAAAGGAVAGNLLLSSFVSSWAGDYAWSVRYQAPVLALLVLPLASLFARPIRGPARPWVWLLICVSCLIQLASVVYNFHLEFMQNPNHGLIPDAWVWDWHQSHLRMRFVNIGRHVAGRRDLKPVAVVEQDPAMLERNRSEQVVSEAYRLNFFPFKAAGKRAWRGLFWPLLAVWVCLLGGFVAAMVGLAGPMRPGEGPEPGGPGRGRAPGQQPGAAGPIR